MISLLMWVLIFGLICYLIFWAMGYLGVPEPVRKIVTVLLVIIAVLYLINNILPGLNMHLPPPMK